MSFWLFFSSMYRSDDRGDVAAETPLVMLLHVCRKHVDEGYVILALRLCNSHRRESSVKIYTTVAIRVT
jgi:hypothetical protein